MARIVENVNTVNCSNWRLCANDKPDVWYCRYGNQVHFVYLKGGQINYQIYGLNRNCNELLHNAEFRDSKDIEHYKNQIRSAIINHQGNWFFGSGEEPIVQAHFFAKQNGKSVLGKIRLGKIR